MVEAGTPKSVLALGEIDSGPRHGALITNITETFCQTS